MTMPRHACDSNDLDMDLSHIHEALTVSHSEALADPRNQVEGLDRAACGPHLKHLAEHLGDANFDVLHSRHPAKELGELADQWPVNVMVVAITAPKISCVPLMPASRGDIPASTLA